MKYIGIVYLLIFLVSDAAEEVSSSSLDWSLVYKGMNPGIQDEPDTIKGEYAHRFERYVECIRVLQGTYYDGTRKPDHFESDMLVITRDQDGKNCVASNLQIIRAISNRIRRLRPAALRVVEEKGSQQQRDFFKRNSVSGNMHFGSPTYTELELLRLATDGVLFPAEDISPQLLKKVTAILRRVSGYRATSAPVTPSPVTSLTQITDTPCSSPERHVDSGAAIRGREHVLEYFPMPLPGRISGVSSEPSPAVMRRNPVLKDDDSD